MIILMNVVCFLSECQGQPGVYAQKDDQERLYGVNDEHKEERVVRLYAVEYEHCLHGEMPWTGTIRCGHYHGYASHDKGDEAARQP